MAVEFYLKSLSSQLVFSATGGRLRDLLCCQILGFTLGPPSHELHRCSIQGAVYVIDRGVHNVL